MLKYAAVPSESFYRDILAQTKTGKWIDFNFEGLVLEVYTSILRPGDIAVDAGANVGVHTLNMAQAVYPKGRVISIESVDELIQNIKDTGTRSYPHVMSLIDFRNIAVSDRTGRATFYYKPNMSGLSSLIDRDWVDAGETRLLDVEVQPLDEILRGEVSPVRFIKLDIEGGEFPAMKGGRRAIARDLPTIVFEHGVHSPKDFGYTVDEMFDFFKDLGYRVYDIFGQRLENTEAFLNPTVWDFVAIHSSKRDLTARVFDSVRKSVAKMGIKYEMPLLN
jgi:FkbM family methyltransferase